jgi:hypothetical protein
LKLKYDEPLSNVAFNVNLRRYTLDAIDKMIDHCFNIDSASPPQYMAQRPPQYMVMGSLRRAVQTAFATLVMYFQERLHAGEMRDVQIKMKQAVVYAGVATPANVEKTLEMWGVVVRRKFDIDNLVLTAKAGRCTQH